MAFENYPVHVTADPARRVGTPVLSEKQVAIQEATSKIGELALTTSAEMRAAELNVETIEDGYNKDVRDHGFVYPKFIPTTNCPVWFILGRKPNKADEKDLSGRPLWTAKRSSFNGKFSTEHEATIKEFLAESEDRGRCHCLAKSVVMTPSGSLLTLRGYLRKEGSDEAAITAFNTKHVSSFSLADIVDVDKASVGLIRTTPSWFEKKIDTAKRLYGGRSESAAFYSYYPFPWDLNGTPLPSLGPTLHPWLPKQS